MVCHLTYRPWASHCDTWEFLIGYQGMTNIKTCVCGDYRHLSWTLPSSASEIQFLYSGMLYTETITFHDVKTCNFLSGTMASGKSFFLLTFKCQLCSQIFVPHLKKFSLSLFESLQCLFLYTGSYVYQSFSIISQFYISFSLYVSWLTSLPDIATFAGCY